VAEVALPDAAARRTIAESLDTTLFVEAGAGSGKTTALVGRVVALVEAGHDLGAVAAITFTEKAAAELRDRVRVALEHAADPGAGGGPDVEVAERCRRAIDALDAAAIGTLHAFAQRLLREHPVEAGLPPAIEVMDEIGSQVAFEERWSVFRERLFTEPGLERVVLLAFSLGVRLSHIEDIAAAFDADWDLVAERVPLEAAEPPPLDVTVLLTAALDTVALRSRCRFDDDKLAARLDAVEQWCTDVAAMATDEVAVLESLAELEGGWHVGRKDNWDGPVDEVRDTGRQLAQLAVDTRARLADGCLRRIASELARFTLTAAEDRRRHGQLQFHDLLVLARELLRGPHAGAARTTLHERYEHLLLDEFQDTDPIQIELALRITAPPGTDAVSWTGLQAEPGRLFVVGDPKQSIYRFRRADVSLFLAASAAIGGGDPLQLHTNFRTVAPVVEWVNHVFGSLIQPVAGAQPPFRALSPVRPAGPRALPAVTVVGAEPHHDEPKADELREREAAGMATAVATALRDGWLVAEHPPGEPERWRPARPGDIAVLLPARTSLAALQGALDGLGVPHRAESSSLVYATPEVRALLMAARAIDDPTDELAVVSALRSSLFGCSDRDLFGWVQRGGPWSPVAPLPPPLPDAPDPVHDAMSGLAQLTRDRAWRTPSELLGHLVTSRRVLELGTVSGHPQDLWRRVRFVVDQARAWSEAGGTGLRAYLRWAARQRSEGARAAEVVLPETDLDAVRIMTIHAAKGLEFPITVVSGLSTLPRRPAGGGRVIWAEGGYEVKAGRGITTARYDDAVALDEQLDHHERLRLLYVACTRARDHLVVSLHRTDAHDDAAAESATSATLLARASVGADHVLLGSESTGQGALPLPLTLAAPAPPAEDWAWADGEAWAAERQRAVASSSRRRAIAATTLARDAVPRDEPIDPGLVKDQRDLELPPWQKGRYGTAVGRAVHAVLQTIDLASGDGLDDAAAAQAAAEGVADRAEAVAALAGAALASPSVRAAAALPHWREVYVAAPFGDTLLEGYLDLLYRDADGLVVVDYKTDHLPDEPSLDARLEHYRLQGAAYALAVERVTQETVSRCVFVFCAPGGAREREVVDLRAAMAEIDDGLARTAPLAR